MSDRHCSVCHHQQPWCRAPAAAAELLTTTVAGLYVAPMDRQRLLKNAQTLMLMSRTALLLS